MCAADGATLAQTKAGDRCRVQPQKSNIQALSMYHTSEEYAGAEWLSTVSTGLLHLKLVSDSGRPSSSVIAWKFKHGTSRGLAERGKVDLDRGRPCPIYIVSPRTNTLLSFVQSLSGKQFVFFAADVHIDGHPLNSPHRCLLYTSPSPRD